MKTLALAVLLLGCVANGGEIEVDVSNQDGTTVGYVVLEGDNNDSDETTLALGGLLKVTRIVFEEERNLDLEKSYFEKAMEKFNAAGEWDIVYPEAMRFGDEAAKRSPEEVAKLLKFDNSLKRMEKAAEDFGSALPKLVSAHMRGTATNGFRDLDVKRMCSRLGMSEFIPGATVSEQILVLRHIVQNGKGTADEKTVDLDGLKALHADTKAIRDEIDYDEADCIRAMRGIQNVFVRKMQLTNKGMKFVKGDGNKWHFAENDQMHQLAERFFPKEGADFKQCVSRAGLTPENYIRLCVVTHSKSQTNHGFRMEISTESERKKLVKESQSQHPLSYDGGWTQFFTYYRILFSDRGYMEVFGHITDRRWRSAELRHNVFIMPKPLAFRVLMWLTPLHYSVNQPPFMDTDNNVQGPDNNASKKKKKSTRKAKRARKGKGVVGKGGRRAAAKEKRS